MADTFLQLLHTSLRDFAGGSWTIYTTGNPETVDFVVPVLDLATNQELEGRINISGIRLVMQKEVHPPEFGLFDRVEVLEFYEGSRNATFYQSQVRDGQAELVQQMLRQIYAVPGYERADHDDPVELTEKEQQQVDGITHLSWMGRWWLDTTARPMLQFMANNNTYPGFSLAVLGLRD